ncbi:MAG: iron chelate uptake ABC transporter family permease subunit [Nanoarchaeota archaeon]|nr:iron chelate uptake ABC transporter family permease subunit [Nanoarchaeota archaeon]
MLDYTLILVFSGCLVLGIVAGTLGSFAVLRKQSLLGDAISHAALPGVAIAFLLASSKHPAVLLLGALCAGWLGTLFILLITRTTRIKNDTAMGIVLSVFFGLGLFLLTLIQRMPSASKAGLDKFLFGNASTLLLQDVWTMLILGGATLACVLLFWKEFKLLSFDPDFLHSLGRNTLILDVFLTTLLVAAIVIGLQAVGVVLMSALVIAPAVAARQWTDHLGRMVALSALFGGVGGVLGAFASSRISNLPTGPAIVVGISVLFIISLFFSPHRGLLKDWLRERKNRKTVRSKKVLLALFTLSRSHKTPFHSHPVSSLEAIAPGSIEGGLEELRNQGLALPSGAGWKLTHKGAIEARRLAQHVYGEMP